MAHVFERGKRFAAGVRLVEVRGHGAEVVDRPDDVVLVVDVYVFWRLPGDDSTTPMAPQTRSLRLRVPRERLPEPVFVGQDLSIRACWDGADWCVESVNELGRPSADTPTVTRPSRVVRRITSSA